MTLSELTPDTALAGMLDGIGYPDGRTTDKVPAYASHQVKTTTTGDYIVVGMNGGAESLTKPTGMFRGSLAVAIVVKTQASGIAKSNIIKAIIAEIEKRCSYKTDSKGEFYFEFYPYVVIMPTTVDSTTGYSRTVLNINWRTTGATTQ